MRFALRFRSAALLPLLVAAPLSFSGCRVSAADAEPAVAADSTIRAGASEPRLTLPAGFTLRTFATGLRGVRFMTAGPGGAIYATLPRSGRVIRLPDDNHDGVADRTEVVIDGLNEPHGLAFHNGTLWVANTDGVVRVPLGANGLSSGPAAYVNHVPGGNGHSTRTVVFGKDGTMYVSVGSSCNLCIEQSPERAAILRFDENGGGKQLFASGLRNAVGLAVHPGTGELWASQNERDNLAPDHENLPPEELNIVVNHGDYGWPFCYGDRIPNPEYHDAARCARTIAPALTFQAHSAPLGMTFLSRATVFPADYRGDLLLALHGSWNRTVPTGAKVVRVHVKNGKPVRSEDFITGWQLPDGKRWGRPADVTVAGDGSVLVSDDAGGTIYRVTH